MILVDLSHGIGLWQLSITLLSFTLKMEATHSYSTLVTTKLYGVTYRDADKSLPRPERKQATATEDSDIHISYL